MKQNKCGECGKKINKLMVDIYTCKCSNVYCPKHLHFHKCEFDHKKYYRDLLREKLPVIKSDRGLITI